MRVAVILGIALAGCSDSSASIVTVEGLPYSFPRNHVNSIVKPEDGHLYVRLHPPGHNFALMHHPRSDRRQREESKLIIATINTSRFSKNWSIATEVGEVICVDRPHFNCGFELYDHELSWSVVFDRAQLPEVSNLKREASSLLANYRRQPAA